MIPSNPPRQARALGVATQRQDVIWKAAQDLLASADVDGVRANKLGPLAAWTMRAQGRPVPAALENDARLATTAWMTSIPLLSRIRSLCEGPLLLVKGPEVAALYPGRSRAFMDVDLLCPDPQAVHATLLANGFVEVGDPELFEDHHHLRPLQWPALWLKVEIHERPLWPNGLRPPPVAEIVAAAVPSVTGVPGISAPDPARHALILASHAWSHEPLQTLRDLIDVAVVAARTDEKMLAAVARDWGLERIWSTTYRAANGLLGAKLQTPAVRVWGRHLPTVSERTVLGNQLQRWLHAFWELPPRAALHWSAVAFRQTALPYPNETWSDKLVRIGYEIAHPRAPVPSPEAGRRVAGAIGTAPEDRSAKGQAKYVVSSRRPGGGRSNGA